jgi:hypothetical protein
MKCWAQFKFVMNKKILKRIEEIFAEKLQAKTGWGRNEIMQAYRESVNEALMELLDT